MSNVENRSVYREQSSSDKDDFEDGLDFNAQEEEEQEQEQDPLETVDELIHQRSTEAVNQAFNSLTPNRSGAAPVEHFSPVRVTFPVNAPPLRPPPQPVMATFEEENGRDSANALQDACRTLQNYAWQPEDLLFYFGQVEIKMAAAGVKKQFTKFQVLSTIIPQNVIEEVKPFLRRSEADYVNNDSYKLLKKEILSFSRCNNFYT